MADTIPKITVIAGDNQFELRNAKNKFTERTEILFPNHIAEYFDGNTDLTFGEFISKIQTPSMFGDVRILFINHAENKNNLAAKSNLEAFEKIMKLCVEDVFVFIEINETTDEKASKNTFSSRELSVKLRATAEKFDGEFFEFKAIREYEIPKWITVKTQEYFERIITEQNAELLVKLSGSDLGVLDGELRKIDAALPPKKEITMDDIYDLTGNNKQISAQEIADFVGMRKWDEKAIAAFDAFAGKDNSFAVPFLSELYRKFHVLLKVRLFAEENKAKANNYLKSSNRDIKNSIALEIGIACGIMKESQKNAVYPIIIKPKIIEQASYYTKNDIFYAINTIAQCDRDIKNGEIKSEQHKATIKELCRKIVRHEL